MTTGDKTDAAIAARPPFEIKITLPDSGTGSVLAQRVFDAIADIVKRDDGIRVRLRDDRVKYDYDLIDPWSEDGRPIGRLTIKRRD